MNDFAIKQVSNYIPSDDTVKQLVIFFSLFCDQSRVKLLSLLAIGNMCVGDICKVLNMNQSTVSHQLRSLRQQNIVQCTRNGKNIFYSLSNTKINEALLLGVEYLGY